MTEVADTQNALSGEESTDGLDIALELFGLGGIVGLEAHNNIIALCDSLLDHLSHLSRGVAIGIGISHGNNIVIESCGVLVVLTVVDVGESFVIDAFGHDCTGEDDLGICSQSSFLQCSCQFGNIVTTILSNEESVGIPCAILFEDVVSINGIAGFQLIGIEGLADQVLDVLDVGAHSFKVSKVNFAPAVASVVVTDIVQMDAVNIILRNDLGNNVGHVGTVTFVIGVDAVVVTLANEVPQTCFGVVGLVVCVFYSDKPSMETDACGMSCINSFLQDVALGAGNAFDILGLVVAQQAAGALGQQVNVGNAVFCTASDDFFCAKLCDGLAPDPLTDDTEFTGSRNGGFFGLFGCPSGHSEHGKQEGYADEQGKNSFGHNVYSFTFPNFISNLFVKQDRYPEKCNKRRRGKPVPPCLTSVTLYL